jgi:hypothetical protein
MINRRILVRILSTQLVRSASPSFHL